MPLSDPSRPAILEVALFSGDIEVEGYDGNEIIIVADAPMRDANGEEEPRPDGLRRIQTSSVGLTVEEGDNKVSLRMDFSPKNVDLEVRVPRRTSVHASLVNGGDIVDHGSDGRARALERQWRRRRDGHLGLGRLELDQRRRACDARSRRRRASPMSFTSFNGDVDVALPANLSADLLVTSQQGDVFTDFDVRTSSQDPAVVERNGDAGGRYRVRMHRETRYAIGSGGPDIQLRTFNGDVMIRKR